MEKIMRIVGVALVLAVLLPGAGCVKQAPPRGTPPKQEAHPHVHPEAGPHGGALAEWGDEKYHAEFTVDHGKKEAVVYILDGSAKKAAPIAAEEAVVSLKNVKPPVQVKLKADPQEGDPKGQASRFRGTDEALAKEMNFEGEISATVAGTPYVGSFEEKEGHHKGEKK
jgi:hypothetical protein